MGLIGGVNLGSSALKPVRDVRLGGRNLKRGKQNVGGSRSVAPADGNVL